MTALQFMQTNYAKLREKIYILAVINHINAIIIANSVIFALDIGGF